MSDAPDRRALRARIDVVSSKAAAIFDEVAADAERILGSDAFAQWVELGCVIAAGSSVAAIKYFRESPALCERIGRDAVDPVLDVALLLGREAPNTALEFFRQAPALAKRLDPAALRQWGTIGADVARQDYGTSIEYVKESARMIGLIPVADFSLWAEVGLRLTREDATVKDYLALEYFRSSAEWLSGLPQPSLRSLLLALAARVALADPQPGASQRPGQVAIEVLRHTHVLLRSLPSIETQRAVLTLGLEVADRAPGLVREFLRHAPEVVALVEGSVTRLSEWVREGLAIADTHAERAEAYFVLRSKQAVEVARRLSHGILLRDVHAALKFYAEGLCGREVAIRSGTGASSAPTDAGGVITLPDKITVYPTPEDNFRFYKVLTLHEAGHLEFGTYDPLPPHVLDWFPRQDEAATQVARPLRSLLDCFPDPGLAQNLWTIVEEARIDFLLRHEYPGIRQDMDRVLFEQLRGRPKLDQLARRPAILEGLLQLSVADTAEVPFPILEVVTSAYDAIKRVRTPNATVEATIRAVIELYPLVAEGLEGAEPVSSESQAKPPPQSEFDQLAMGHAPIGSFALRDTLSAPRFRAEQRGGAPADRSPSPVRIEDDRPEDAASPVIRESRDEDELTASGRAGTADGAWYDEWDEASQEYKPRWCRVVERPAAEGAIDEVEDILVGHRGIIASLRRSFEVLRPEAFRKQRQQTDGDEIDLEAAVDAAVERRAGLPGSDRVYIRREKKVRDVSVAFLIDASGSTSRQLVSGGGRPRRVIDVEREGLILLSEALDALGDEFALFAFSGQSRHDVSCLVIKDFDTRPGPAVLHRIGGLRPMGQNRDGAAIRHIASRLRQRTAAVKLLIILSDGRPLDDGYAGSYALDDVKVALREARAHGIRPFCITVDETAGDYVRTMYGEVNYTVIHNVAALPTTLPRLYKRLTT
ncbi:MAG: VWA domain-containing protein [Nitrospirae bacterium]|nr:VWA domain-containing protein [Nitrospirota bacterium]